MTDITVEVWSDLVCPWCFIGKRRLERAIDAVERHHAVRVVWRSFELDPNASRRAELTVPEHLQRDRHLDTTAAAEAIGRVTALAAEVGLVYHLDRARPVNSFDAHRVMHLAEARGVGEPVRERLMRAYTAEGAHLADPQTLVGLGVEAGLDPAATRALLDGDDFAAAVRADEERARRLFVTGVPTFVFNGAFVVTGAQPVPVLVEALRGAAQAGA